MPLDPQQLPDDPQTLRKMIVDLSAQLDRQAVEKLKIERMVRELLDAKRLQSSERLSPEQLALFEALWQTRQSSADGENKSPDDEQTPPTAGGGEPDEAKKKSRGGRRPLSARLERQRIVHDLAEADKHCAGCGETLRPIGEDASERYEYVPASLTVVEDVCLKLRIAQTARRSNVPASQTLRSRLSSLSRSSRTALRSQSIGFNLIRTPSGG